MSHFQVCWSVVTRGCVFLAALSNSRQKTSMGDFSYKSLKPWKIDNIDLTLQFSLSIFTDFRYQSMKITRLLTIFIDWLLRDLRPFRQNRNPFWISVSLQNTFPWGASCGSLRTLVFCFPKGVCSVPEAVNESSSSECVAILPKFS